MNTFLFLYPIAFYFNRLKEIYGRMFPNKEYDSSRINEIIDTRYRKENYQIYWLTFCSEKNKKEPDLSILSKDIFISKQDTVITNNIPFNYFYNSCGSKRPDLNLIFEQISEINNLVLGGFHQWDCVNGLAEYANSENIPVIVDEDTTEVFFARTIKYGSIPLSRKSPFQIEDRRHADTINLQRAFRPWFSLI